MAVVVDKVLVMEKMSNTDTISNQCGLAVHSYVWLFTVDLVNLLNPWFMLLSFS